MNRLGITSNQQQVVVALVSFVLSGLIQNPGMIAGVMQKVNPFKSSQPKVRPPTVITLCV